jgi:hypothetical protein
MAPDIGASSLIDLSAKFKVTGEGGLVFDQYSESDFKFVTISAGKVTLGHRTATGSFVDATYANSSIVNGTDYTLGLTLKGTTVSVTLNNALVLSKAFNALVTDGDFGLISSSGTTSYDSVTFNSDDPGLLDTDYSLTASKSGSQAVGDLSLTQAQVATVAEVAKQKWIAALGEGSKATLDEVRFELVNDLPGNAIAWTIGDGRVLIDMSAAGHGWFVDVTPYSNNEYRKIGGDLFAKKNSAAFGRMDLLTAISHELGHVLGYGHGSSELMGSILSAGVREFAEAPASSLLDLGDFRVGIGERANQNGINGLSESRLIGWEEWVAWATVVDRRGAKGETNGKGAPDSPSSALLGLITTKENSRTGARKSGLTK